MDKVQVVPLVAALADQLLFHVGHDVIVLGVDGHYAPVAGYLLEDFPEGAVGDPGSVECGEYLEAGHAGLDGLSDLADGSRGYSPGQDVMKGVVNVGVAGEGVPPVFHLLHDGSG